ncbi:MAG: hypothetical protein PHG83_00030 [Patescibacteria group bacterium]|nr:hypothetical protein [Patescibacteria group bacterium]
MKENLDEFLRRLIGEREGIGPIDINCRCLRILRAKRGFPVIINFSGFSTSGFQIITPEQAKISDGKLDDLLKKFS